MENTESTHPKLKSADHYHNLVASFVAGYHRLMSARAGTLTSIIALLKFREAHDQSEIDGQYAAALAELSSMSYEEYDSFFYLINLSHLVYATTLLDTYLSDTTRFLLLLHPGALGGAQAFDISDLLAAKNKSEVLELAVTKKTREIAYGSFVERVRYLNRTFKLGIHLQPELLKALEHYSGVRNVIIHDQALYDIGLADDGTVVTNKKTCPRHPTPVSNDQFRGARKAYGCVVSQVYEAVSTRVLKVEPDQSLLNALNSRDPPPCPINVAATGK